ncbi:MAG: type II secretion system F family protein [Cytophagales bacterium]|nr:type II secretion system F family protein [Armatimonadota bacterium]
MPTYSYDARDLSGNVLSGIIEADAPGGAAASLREQGLYPSRIERVNNASVAVVTPPRVPEVGYSGPLNPPTVPTSGPPPPLSDGESSARGISLVPWLSGVGLQDLAMMYRQMSTLFDAGVPMVQALSTLSEQTRGGKLRAILQECAGAVGSGYPLSSVMFRYPLVFTTLQYEMIRAGETSGMLDLMCRRLAGYLEREIELRRKLKRETLYQKIVGFVASLVILLLAALVGGMPMFLQVVALEAGVLAAGFGVWWLARFLYQFPQLAAAWDGVKLLIPGLGGVVRRYSTARFCRALGTLYSGGVNLTKAVEISARACGNGAISQRLLANASALNYGEGLSGMLTRSGLLSPIAVQMARTGEQTGSLDTMMEKVADYLEDEADVKAHQLATGFGVAMSLLAGLLVLIIAITFFTGYFNAIFTGADKFGG